MVIYIKEKRCFVGQKFLNLKQSKAKQSTGIFYYLTFHCNYVRKSPKICGFAALMPFALKSRNIARLSLNNKKLAPPLYVDIYEPAEAISSAGTFYLFFLLYLLVNCPQAAFIFLPWGILIATSSPARSSCCLNAVIFCFAGFLICVLLVGLYSNRLSMTFLP